MGPSNRVVVALALTAMLVAPRASPAQIADQDAQRRSLRGVDKVEVVVEDLDLDAERRLVLDAHKIHADIVRRLYGRGVHVSSLNADGVLYVKLIFLAVRDPLSAFSLEVSLRQSVTTVRSPRIELVAPTWIRTRLGTTAQLHSPAQVIRDLVDEFAQDYSTVNPRR